MSNPINNQNVPQTDQFMNKIKDIFIIDKDDKDNVLNLIPKNNISINSREDSVANSENKQKTKIPDIVELFNEIDIPFNEINKNLFLTIFLHSLNQVKSIATITMNDFKEDISKVIEKIEDAIKNKDFLKQKINYANLNNPIDILNKMERKVLTPYDIFRIYLSNGEEKNEFLVKLVKDIGINKNIEVFEKDHFDFEQEIYQEYSCILDGLD